MQGTNMISNDAANDRTTEQQPVCAGERVSTGLGVLFGFIRDHLGYPAAKINNLRPVKIISWQVGAARTQLISTVDPKGLTGRLREFCVVLGKHRNVCEPSRF